MKHNLKDTTFLIPLRIDHKDRLVNAHIVLNYLTKNFDTNIIVFEDGLKSHWKDFNVEDDKDITYFFVHNEDKLFHRMKMLNIMLSMAKTKVVANYDIDCLLNIEVYLKVQKMIIEDGYDFLNPFSNNDKLNDGVVYVDINKKFKMIHSSFKESPSKVYQNDNLKKNTAGCGFIVFFNRLSYLSLGGENEDFYAYGPEDKERFYRFNKLGFKTNNYVNKNDYNSFEPFVIKTENLNNKVYHLEHYRSGNSSTKNTYYTYNLTVYDYILKLDNKKLLEKYINDSGFDLNYYNEISKNNFSDKIDGFNNYINNKNKYDIFPRKRNILTMTRIGENGRLGNQMFQFVILLVLSIKYNMEIKLPIIKTKDKYKNFRLDDFFDLDYSLLDNSKNFKKFDEKQFHYDNNYENILKEKKDIKNDFDWEFYLDFNIDLRKNGINDEKSAIKHWNKNGILEGRLYNKYQHKFSLNYDDYFTVFDKQKKKYKCNLCSESFRKVASKNCHFEKKHKKHKDSIQKKYTKPFFIKPVILKKINLDINGYFQSLKYFSGFEKLIRKTFKFKKHILKFCKNFMNKYKDNITIGIHVRRGDHIYKKGEPNYIPPHYTITPKVFENIINFFEKKNIKNKKYLIFTENEKERNWCKNNFKKMDNIEYVSETKDIHDICLMTLCDHLVISCSTYSWWGAWLSEKNRIILRPNKWFNQKHDGVKNNIVELFPENWIEYRVDL